MLPTAFRKTILALALLVVAGPARAQTWTVLTNSNPSFENTFLPMLMTDGTVIFQGAASGHWWQLTPDNTGSYVNGTWTQGGSSTWPGLASPPYQPEYVTSAMLPDGRPLLMGGVGFNLGGIYNRTLGAWRNLASPFNVSSTTALTQESVVLPSGALLLGAQSSSSTLNATTLAWTATTGAPTYSNTGNAWVLLPNGKVLATPAVGGTASQTYDPSTGLWSNAGTVPVTLASGTYYNGASMYLPSGIVVALGARYPLSTSSPTPSAIYTTGTGIWSSGPNLPFNSPNYLSSVGTAIALLPSGNALVMLGAATNQGNSTTNYFYEYDGTTFTLEPSPTIVAGTVNSDVQDLLTLPTGEVLYTAPTYQEEVYTPASLTPCSGCTPAITSFPATITRGVTYTLGGTQLNGLSEAQNQNHVYHAPTNFPLVRVVNTGTGHVFYGRTFNASTGSIAPGTSMTTSFTFPLTVETGASSLYAVANGIPSSPVSVTIQ